MILQTKTLFISAGHSDTDPGAVANGTSEAAEVLEFRDLLAQELRGKLVFAKDGEPGQNLPLSQAWRMAAKHDVAVEFHCNAFSSPSATGVETLSASAYYTLGNELCRVISSTLGIANRGAKGEASGQHSRLAFISKGGGIIVELFFLSNPSDLASYRKHRRALAAAVAGVLIDAVTDRYADLENDE